MYCSVTIPTRRQSFGKVQQCLYTLAERDSMKALQYLQLVDTVWIAGKEQCVQSFLDPNAFSKYSALVGKRDVDRKSKAMEPQRPIMET